jgi:phosphatidylserine decarboxylase
MALVLVGALFVGSIETVYAGEINPPEARGNVVQDLAAGRGTQFARGQELARFNMGSTVVALFGRGARISTEIVPGATVRLGQLLARKD